MIPFEFLEVITEILYLKKIHEEKSISMIGDYKAFIFPTFIYL